MASNFYQRMTTLYEEFQKRELQYLKAEENMRSSMEKKNNVQSLEQYLLKIRNREKENEEIYRNLMLQVDDLSHRTELISLKLDKLSILQDTAVSSTISSLPVHNLGFLTGDTFQKNRQFSNPISAINTSSELYVSSLKPTVQSFSTQTEDMFCENCNFPKSMHLNQVNQITTENNRHMNEFQTRISDVHPKSTFQNSIATRDIYNNDSSSKDADLATDTLQKYASQYDIPSTPANTSFNMTASSVNEIFDAQENHSVLRHETQALSAAFDESSGYAKGVISEISTEEIQAVTEGNETAIDPVTVKSDNESMNHEFDFLESDKRDSAAGVFQDNSVGNNSSSHINSSVPKDNNLKSEIDFDSRNTASHEGVRKKSLLTSDRTNEASDVKSDSSVSAGPRSPSVRSENVSAASDSDSSYGKETPLTTTAAYRALLGNTFATDRSKKPISDSDTEDEVEKALANAVRKPSSALLDTSQMQKEEVKKDIPQETESKSIPRPSKPATFNKPQSKLSKSTRKVLGLETSSESEVELAVKPSTKAKNVDDDEFEFFD